MKTQFWTRKGYLGLLMTLVLAFGVLGVVEAQTVTRRSSDDLKIRDIGDSDRFRVSFSVSGVDTADNRHEVTIPDFTDMILKKIGSNTVIADHENGVTLKAVLGDNDQSYQRLRNTSYTLEYAVDGNNATAGDRTITIGGVAFTVYVVTPPHLVPNPSTTVTSPGVHYAYKGVEQRIDGAFTFTPENAPVFYSVQGSGSLYVGANERRLRLPNGTMTSSSADVYLKGHTGTSRITAFVAWQ